MKFIKPLVFAFAILLSANNSAFAQTTTANQNTDGIKTATIKVKGITCSMDVKMISANVEKINGVNSCKAGKQGPMTSFEVKYNPALVTEKDIYAAIEKTGSCENPDDRPYKIKQ